MSFIKHLPTCSECKHADYYLNWWSFQYSDPRCCITHNRINHDDLCCESFEYYSERGAR